MGKIGCGYGSEWNLLRYLGYHRAYLSQKVLEVMGGDQIDWLDFEFSKGNQPSKNDQELCGLEFIQNAHVQEQWKTFWPQTGNSQNWDAVGKIYYGDQPEWLLVEAKGHLGELRSSCGATSENSRQTIRLALEKTSVALGNYRRPADNWLKTYYQYANRLSVLYFLMNECLPPVQTRLLFIYFYGENRKNLECPQNEQEWLPTIESMMDYLGIDVSCELANRIHHLFLPVNPAGADPKRLFNNS